MADGGRAGVLGHPIAHSISPEIFRFLSRKLNQPVQYERFDVTPSRLRAFVRDQGANYMGWNVTLPHKEAMARILRATLSPTAAATGAVNVVARAAGRLQGHNTDVTGIIETLREQRLRARGLRALVLGSGGAAAAVGYALGSGGAAEVVFVARRTSRAQALARRLGRVCPRTRFRGSSTLRGAKAGPFELVVNATPLGMKGFSRKSALDPGLEGAISGSALAFDLIYKPEKTEFLNHTHRLGLRGVGGLDMLIWQAIATWEIWYSPIKPKSRRDALKKALKSHLRAHFRKEKK